MSLKETFKEIEEMTSLLLDLVNKQTEGFEDELSIIYKFSVIHKIFLTVDKDLDEAKEIKEYIDQIKGSLLLAEEN